MTAEIKMTLDMENRDPNDLNQHIKVMFEDVVAEPEGVRSMDCTWVNGFKCFECGKNVCYRILTLFCGLCIALFWGCEFAVTSFAHIWCYTPFIRDFSIGVGCLKKIFKIVLDCCVAPVCESFGLLFAKIHIEKL
ncbi:caveolin-1-like [Mercenaria mercenaria]|uniref:caveolin-1-like n=1 Tax=Mercenaria mercenaria TaxID=6596 RepID=UPI00234E83D7|nr:caveolin-1-like [Mercenaria mercenaria]